MIYVLTEYEEVVGVVEGDANVDIHALRCQYDQETLGVLPEPDRYQWRSDFSEDELSVYRDKVNAFLAWQIKRSDTICKAGLSTPEYAAKFIGWLCDEMGFERREWKECFLQG